MLVDNLETMPYEKLVALLEHEDKWVRLDALIEVEARDETRAVPVILRRLSQEDRTARPRFIQALGALRAQEAVAPLIELLKREHHIETLSEIPAALALIGDRAAVEPLKQCLARAEAEIVEEAIKALFLFRCGDIVDHLEGMLKDLQDEQAAEGDQMEPSRSRLLRVIVKAIPAFRKLPPSPSPG